MRITLAQTSPKLNRSNLGEIIDIINTNMINSDLIVFPELSLNGYLLQDKLFEDAWTLDELYELRELSENIDIVVGAALRDSEGFRNAALYFSKGKLLNQHIKCIFQTTACLKKLVILMLEISLKALVLKKKK